MDLNRLSSTLFRKGSKITVTCFFRLCWEHSFRCTVVFGCHSLRSVPVLERLCRTFPYGCHRCTTRRSCMQTSQRLLNSRRFFAWCQQTFVFIAPENFRRISRPDSGPRFGTVFFFFFFFFVSIGPDNFSRISRPEFCPRVG